MADDGFHEIQLSRKQLIALFMGAAVVLVVAFLTGVLVGRGVKGGVAGEAAAANLAAPVTEAPPEEPAPAGTRSGPPPSVAPPQPVDEDLSYQARLEAKVPPADSVKAAQPAARAAAAPPATPPPATAAQPAVNDGGSGWLVQVQALRDRASADGVAKRLAGKGYKAFVMAPGPTGSRLYRVVVGRFKTRGEAEEAKRRLEKEEKFKPWIIS